MKSPLKLQEFEKIYHEEDSNSDSDKEEKTKNCKSDLNNKELDNYLAKNAMGTQASKFPLKGFSEEEKKE